MTDPAAHLDKTYHVQIDRLPDADLLARLCAGVADDGEVLLAKSVRELRRGEKNAWLEIVLDEGRNRQIRRLLAAFDIAVLRLIRVAIGGLALGDLAKGRWRVLAGFEVVAQLDQLVHRRGRERPVRCLARESDGGVGQLAEQVERHLQSPLRSSIVLGCPVLVRGGRAVLSEGT